MTFNDLFPYLFGTMFVAIWAVVGYRFFADWRAGKSIKLEGLDANSFQEKHLEWCQQIDEDIDTGLLHIRTY